MSQFLRNPFFGLTALLGMAFVVTILAMVSTMFGDPRSPMYAFFDRVGGQVIVGEVVAILVAGFLAMAVDRWQTLRESRSANKPGDAGPPANG